MKTPAANSKHFTAEAWLDFVRKVAPPGDKALMQRHLDSGCKACSQLFEAWAAVLEVTTKERANDPPESAVRLVKAAFAQGKPWRPVPQGVRIARLIFDSFRQPVLAGSRGSVVPTRQLLHKSGPFLVDVSIEPNRARNQVLLVGQVLNSKTPQEVMKDVEVVLQRGLEVVAQATTDSLGEFHLEFRPQENLRLFVDVPGDRAIGIVLPGSEASAPRVPGESQRK
jgi:hypothetical protein